MTRRNFPRYCTKHSAVDIGGKLSGKSSMASETSLISAAKTSKHCSSQQDDNIIFFSDQAKWESWLRENHTMATPVWIKIAKLKSGIPSVTYAEALDVALCYGWIDSTRRSVDDNYFMQRFSARRGKSNWSAVNKVHVERLAKAGRIQSGGYKVIDEAKADGRWVLNNKK